MLPRLVLHFGYVLCNAYARILFQSVQMYLYANSLNHTNIHHHCICHQIQSKISLHFSAVAGVRGGAID